MHRSAHQYDAIEVTVVGPLPLQSAEPQTLLWLLKAGEMTLGAVSLSLDHHHVAEVRDLQLLSPDARARQAHSAKLMCALAEYAREHGILKLKVHENSRRDWLPQQLSRLGFSDAARTAEEMEFYLDLYQKPIRRRVQATNRAAESYQLAC